MTMKDKGFKILLFIFVLLFLGDMITTLMLSEFLDVLELNWAYPYIGIMGIVILNIILIWCIWFLYNGCTVGQRFAVMNFMVSLCFLRVVAIYNASTWIRNRPTLEYLEQTITESVKAEATFMYSAIYIIPLLVCMFTYIFWRLDHEVTRKV